MKKYGITFFILVLLASSLQARRGWYGSRRWGGWGPGFGIGLTIPIGGSSYKPIVSTRVDDPYNRYKTLFPQSDPLKVPNSYQRWLFSNYPQTDAQYWWNSFVNNMYNPYQASKPRPSSYLSIGSGYPYGGFYGYPYRPYGYGWRPYGGIGFGIGF